MKKKKKKKKKRGMRGRNYYTKFFGGKLLLEHLHPPTHTIFSSKNSQLAPSLPENFYLRNEKLLNCGSYIPRM